jgi:glucosamine-6-phosphate deaminase
MAGPIVRVADDTAGVAQLAADVVEATIRQKPNAVFAMPTGRTPVPLYRELARRYQDGRLDFSKTRVFNLDEWVGVASDDDGSFAQFMNEHFYSRVNVPPYQRAIPNALAMDLDAECRHYEELIQAAGGLDLAILGLGGNGHIGFNEPGTSFQSHTHVVELMPETLAANRFMFANREPPNRGLSMGIATILEARRVLMLVTGGEKASILACALNGPIDESVPASALQRHPAVEVVVDRAAAGKLVVG